jgi:DNA-binding response OmpR family regulator
MSKILVVDDDPALLAATTRGLRLHGHDAEGVPNAAAGLAALNHRTFDLVLTDWEMPGMQGDALCRAVKDKYRLPVILVSGNHLVYDVKCGADKTLMKPYDSRDLHSLIDSLILLAASREPVRSQ